ncbi:hypothetical protein GOEFS_109_00060 [Gordonia effusa NBRC 100432]|uniref:Phosphoadenosine phosphosulphate reductase domain-containing protein n=1 Tax=Gordonia effusa NBRC 100432 TaxID=1077974 RepID=H0R5B0_9ACTN|nr:phosphoadenosine phosphosulfate reductase family protein [Gordonia effusa]GAB20261.1 hypothetical protein GOEFS_109_00060 [Gordonia effusa NBRC 100432]
MALWGVSQSRDGLGRPTPDTMIPQVDKGLDLTVLQGIRGTRIDHAHLLARIEEYCDGQGWVAWSGGKDSTVVVDLARRVDPNIPVVFYDCGLDYPETRTYLAEMADRWGLNLHVVPTRPDLLTALVAAGDFDRSRPTQDLGIDMRAAMITAPARRAHAVFGDLNLWGVRSAESVGRRRLHRTQLARNDDDHGGIVRRSDGTSSYSPIWNWQDAAVWEYLAARNIEPNPVYSKLSALGATGKDLRVDAMIDPRHLDAGQVRRLAHGWPALFAGLTEALPTLTDYL